MAAVASPLEHPTRPRQPLGARNLRDRLVSCFRYKLGSDARSDTLAAMVRPLVVAGFWLAVLAALALTLNESTRFARKQHEAIRHPKPNSAST